VSRSSDDTARQSCACCLPNGTTSGAGRVGLPFWLDIGTTTQSQLVVEMVPSTNRTSQIMAVPRQPF